MKKNTTTLLNRFRTSRLFWPLVAWAIILIFNAIVDPSFFELGIIEDPTYGKHLYSPNTLARIAAVLFIIVIALEI